MSVSVKVSNEAEVLIYDEIGFEDADAKTFVTNLNELGGQDITVRINSAGGSVFDGLAIYNALKAYEGNVHVVIDGIALSMASGIAMAGDTIEMAANALMMIHDPQSIAAGDERDMARATAMLKAAKESLVMAYASKSGLAVDRVKELMSEETWLTAQEALDLGLIDTIGAEVAVAASFLLPESIKVPAAKVQTLFNVLSIPATPNQTELEMSETTTSNDTKQAPEPATLEQLSALNGATNDFVVEQMKAKATLEQAQNALNQALVEQLQAATRERDEAVEEAQKQAEQNVADNSGHDPASNDRNEQTEAHSDPVATFRKLLRDKYQAGVTGPKAYAAVRKENPGLVEAMRPVSD